MYTVVFLWDVSHMVACVSPTNEALASQALDLFTLPSSGVKSMTCAHGKEPDTVKATAPVAGTKAPANEDLPGKYLPWECRRGLVLGIPVPSNL